MTTAPRHRTPAPTADSALAGPARRRHRVLAVGGLALVLAATGCSNGLRTGSGTGSDSALSSPSASAGPSSSSPSPSASASRSPSPSSSASSSSSSSSSAPTPASSGDGGSGGSGSTGSSGGSGDSSGGSGPGRCTYPDLSVGTKVPDGAGTAGGTYLLVTFENTSSGSCTLDGFPGVSFVGDGDGTQLGDAASRSGSARAVTLRAGGSTTALLRVADAGAYPEKECAPTTSDGLRVYPPGSREAAFVRFRTQACQGSTGGSPQLQVSSVGTGS